MCTAFGDVDIVYPEAVVTARAAAAEGDEEGAVGSIGEVCQLALPHVGVEAAQGAQWLEGLGVGGVEDDAHFQTVGGSIVGLHPQRQRQSTQVVESEVGEDDDVGVTKHAVEVERARCRVSAGRYHPDVLVFIACVGQLPTGGDGTDTRGVEVGAPGEWGWCLKGGNAQPRLARTTEAVASQKELIWGAVRQSEFHGQAVHAQDGAVARMEACRSVFDP